MTSFQIIRKLSEIIGIYMSTVDRNSSINLRSFACFSSKFIYFSASVAYLGIRANSPQEYGRESVSYSYLKKHTIYFLNNFTITGETFFICATEMAIGIIFISIIFNIVHVTKLIEKFEAFIQTSKLWAMSPPYQNKNLNKKWNFDKLLKHPFLHLYKIS